MSDIAEGIGGAVEGALFGRSIEKSGGSSSGSREPHEPAECPNCGTMSASTFCPDCGQKRHIHRTLGAIFHDLIHGVLHLDGKFWKTLPLLVFKPGHLTRRYIEGERAKFVSPMAMFLFSVFAMFAVFQMVGISTPTELDTGSAERLRELANQEIASLEERQADLTAELAAATDPQDRAAIEQQLETANSQLTAIAEAQTEVPFLREIVEGEGETILNGVPVTTDEDGVKTVPLNRDGSARLTIGGSKYAWAEEAVEKWRDNPTLMLYKLQANAYKFSWLLIPLSIPFVWLLFAWKRRFKAYDHAIFVTYSLSFVSLLFIAVSLMFMVEWLAPVAAILMAVVPPLHLYKQLRHTYELSRFGALWRLLVLSAFIWVVIVMFLQVLLLLGAF